MKIIDALQEINFILAGDQLPPEIEALLNDTGLSSSDGITSDPLISGKFFDEYSGIARAHVRVDGGSLLALNLDGTGGFQFDASLGGTLGDGQHTLQFVAFDRVGNSRTLDLEYTLDTASPDLQLALSNDTGISSTDGVTSLADVLGSITDTSSFTLRAGFDDRLEADFVEVTAQVQPDGSFLFNEAVLEQILQDSLVDGSHTLRIVATDEHGQTSGPLEIAFELDRQAPTPSAIDLSATSDSGARGDLITGFANVTFVGTVEGNATISLDGTAISSRASHAGILQLNGVSLVLGDNSFTARAQDVAGNTATFQLDITRLDEVLAPDPVLYWNEVLLEAIRQDATTPPVASRNMAMMAVAMYDALSAIEGTPGFAINLPLEADTSPYAAAISAAHAMLIYAYPALQGMLDSELATSLDLMPDDAAKTAGINYGQSVAAAVIAMRADDGWDDFVDYLPGSAPGEWRPTAPAFEVGLLPQWAELMPFAMTGPDQFLPQGPPDLTSTEYAEPLNEVKVLGSANSTVRTADQTEIARFWTDGLGTYSPPGHWNQIASEIVASQRNSILDNARLFAQLNVALADAAVTAWSSKYTYEFWRPIDAIHLADQDGNDATMADPTWRPLLITPPFPEYVSGHSTFSGAAAAEVLTQLLGDNISFTAESLGLPGVTRSFSNFDEAAEEAGRSRIYGGIHYIFSDVDGLEAGRAVAQQVLRAFSVTTDDKAPSLLVESPQRGVAAASNLTIEGRVLDNLSGVELLQVQINDGAFAPASFDASGEFSLTTTFALDGTDAGLHTFRFRAVDFAGNATPLIEFNFTLDTAPPEIAISSLSDGGELSAGARLAGTADGTGSNLRSLSYQFDGGTSMPIAFDSAGNFNVPLDLMHLSAGGHTLTVTARDRAGHTISETLTLNLAEMIPLTVTRFTPQDRSSEISSTYRPQVYFSRPIDPASLNDNNFYATDTTGSKLAATIVPGMDRTFAWLFFTAPMPSASTITIHVDGSTILTAGDAQPLDADGNGSPGGVLEYQFTTVSLTPLPGTTLTGRVFDPGPDLKAMTQDDVRVGPDGIMQTADDEFLNPLAGVKVFILGMEDDFVLTDANGYFHFDAVPGGNIKLAVDGRTATNALVGVFFPEMVMDLEVEIGQANTVMGSMGARDDREANRECTEVYLPRLETSLLKDISTTENTKVGVDAKSAPNLTTQQRQMLELDVQPNSIIGMDGQPLANAQVGISTVPPELVRDMLPTGLMQHSFDITIQAPDAAVFSAPLQINFPNVFNAEPGTKLNFLSFDHTTGRLVIEGTATVSEDGLSVVTDPDTGITKPGWHGMTPPGSDAHGVPGEPCLDDSGRVALGLAAAGEIGAEMYKMVKDATKIGDLAAKGFGVPSPNGKILGSFFSGASIAKSLKNALETPANSGYEITLKILYVGEALGKTAQAFLSLIPLVRDSPVVKALDAARVLADTYVEHTEAADRFAQAENNIRAAAEIPPCDPGDQPAAQSLADAIANDLAELQQRAGEQSQVIEQLQDMTDGIADFVKNADPTRPDLGYSDEELADFADLVDIYPDLADQLDASPFYDPGGLLAKLPRFSDYYTEHPNRPPSDGGHIVLRPLYWSADLGNTVLRGRTSAVNSISFFAPPNQWIQVGLYDPNFNRIGQSIVFTNSSGFATDLGRIPLFSAVGLPDTDGEGLVDDAEFIIGTSATERDTDRDGVSDLAEVQQSQDPLTGRSLVTGVVSNPSLLGEAKEIVLEGSLNNSEAQLGYVATGSYGLAIVNASQFTQPTVLGQIDLPGDAVDVAVDIRLGIAVVAATSGGLHLVDVTDPTTPTLMQTINVQAGMVEVVEGIAYVGVGNELRTYELLTGERLQSLPLGGQNLTGLAREGAYLYTMEAGRVLRSISISTGIMTAADSVIMPAGGANLSVGGGIAYVTTTHGFFGGFATADISNPSDLQVISGVDATNIVGQDMAVNGSGLAVSVGFLGGIGNQLHVVDVSNPASTDQFVTQFNLPSVPFSVSIAGGIAYVAGGAAGLQVVNYAPFDRFGQAPVVNISSAVADIDSETPGIQVIEGTTVVVAPAISDDVQVRNVELLVNGQIVRNDVSFPFDLSATVPVLPNGDSSASVTIEVRATDTGGNVTTSAPIILDVVPDTVAPTIAATNPNQGGKRGLAFRSLVVDFSESMDTATLTADSIQLIGPSGVLVPFDIQTRRDDQSVQLTYQPLEPGSYQLTIDKALVADRAGNAVGTGLESIDFSIEQYTAVFTNPTGGFWDEPSNWDTGVVPGPFDDVLIDVPGGATITHRSGTSEIRSLASKNPFVLSGGTLKVAQTAEFDSTFNLNGGTLSDATVVFTGGQSLNVSQGGFANRLIGVTIQGELLLNAVNAYVSIEGGTTFTTARLTGNNSSLGFAPGETITGTVLLAGYDTKVTMNGMSGTLTVASGGAIRTAPGANGGDIGETFVYFSRGSMTLVNQGLISSDVAGQTLAAASLASLDNQGTLQATNGGTLRIGNLQPNAGNIDAGIGSLVTVIGGLQNSASGIFSVAVQGTSVSDFGRVNVTGAATLDGTLIANFVNGYLPNIGDTFQSVLYGSRTGTFANITTTGLDAGLGLSPLYDVTGLTLEIVAALMSAQVENSRTGDQLTTTTLQPVASKAIEAWGTDPGVTDMLFRSAIEWQIADLGGEFLAYTNGKTIWIDDDAAGNGWFVDPTPGVSDEFLVGTDGLLHAEPDQLAADRVDLFTVLVHEIVHLLGLNHEDGGVMEHQLGTGVRSLPDSSLVDRVFGEGI